MHGRNAWRSLLWIVVATASVGCSGGSPRTPLGPQQPTLTLTAQPSTVASGSAVTLSWASSNATAVNIAGLGSFGPSGNVTVTPTVTTTYTAIATGPGGTATSSATVTVSSTAPPQPPAAGVPQFGHVFVVVEENSSYSSVIGNPAMPYLNSLASQYGLATQYYANTHPSIGNYFMLTTGQIITNNDSFNSVISADNIVRHLLTAGKTWKSYAENLPNVGYTGFDVYPYAKKHNPFAFFSDVANSSTEVNNLVPFTQFASDLASDQLPQFSFIVPNLLDDAHDGTLQQADTWLKHNLGPLVSSATFQKDGLLIVVFDEAATSDSTHGGGHIACVIVSPLAKKGYQSTTFYQHQNALRLMLEGLGLNSFPGAAANAADMAEFF